MRNNDVERKMRSAEKLFDAIGMIDDRFIAEAMDTAEYCSKAPQKKKVPFLRRYATSLTALLLVVVMAGGFVVANLSGVLDFDGLDENLKDDIGEVGQSHKSLDFVLTATTPSTALITLEEIDFFDGEVSLIWNCGDEDGYHKLTFRESNAETLVKNCMSSSVKQISAETADENVCKVWISYGNGEVVSPYLKESEGNVGYAELFEYSPEVIPSDSFCDLVSDAIGN